MKPLLNPSSSKGNSPAGMQYSYPCSVECFDGILTPLPEKLARTFDFDSISLEDLPASKRVTLWFRQGAKRIFYISLIRKGGKCLARMGGQDPSRVLAGVTVCRDYLDQFFGINPRELEVTVRIQAEKPFAKVKNGIIALR